MKRRWTNTDRLYTATELLRIAFIFGGMALLVIFGLSQCAK